MITIFICTYQRDQWYTSWVEWKLPHAHARTRANGFPCLFREETKGKSTFRFLRVFSRRRFSHEENAKNKAQSFYEVAKDFLLIFGSNVRKIMKNRQLLPIQFKIIWPTLAQNFSFLPKIRNC